MLCGVLLHHVGPVVLVTMLQRHSVLLAAWSLAPVIKRNGTKHDGLGPARHIFNVKCRHEHRPLLFAQLLQASAAYWRVGVTAIRHPANERQPGRALGRVGLQRVAAMAREGSTCEAAGSRRLCSE